MPSVETGNLLSARCQASSGKGSLVGVSILGEAWNIDLCVCFLGVSSIDIHTWMQSQIQTTAPYQAISIVGSIATPLVWPSLV